MTEKELRKLAKSMGYYIKKITPLIKRLPCTCGHKKPVAFPYEGCAERGDEFYIRCPRCGLRGPKIRQHTDLEGMYRYTIDEVRNKSISAWNEMINRRNAKEGSK